MFFEKNKMKRTENAQKVHTHAKDQKDIVYENSKVNERAPCCRLFSTRVLIKLRSSSYRFSSLTLTKDP